MRMHGFELTRMLWQAATIPPSTSGASAADIGLGYQVFSEVCIQILFFLRRMTLTMGAHQQQAASLRPLLNSP